MMVLADQNVLGKRSLHGFELNVRPALANVMFSLGPFLKKRKKETKKKKTCELKMAN